MGDLELLATPRTRHCSFCLNADASHQEDVTHQARGRTYLISTSRINSEDGGARTIHVLKDITDKREAERRYRRERDFNRNILNNTRSMILVLDTAGLISYSNRRCAEAGFSEQELLGQPLANYVPAGRRASFLEALDRTLAGAAVELETPLSRDSRTVGQFSISLSPMRDEQGNINSIVVVMADITDAVDLQAKLMHTEKMAAIGQLVSGVAHEVNNPLAAIVGFTDLLLENPKVPEDAKRDLQIILQEAQRTRTIVQNLFSFARQMPAQHEPVQLNSIVRQTLKLRAYDFSNRDIGYSRITTSNCRSSWAIPTSCSRSFSTFSIMPMTRCRRPGTPGKIEITTSHSAGNWKCPSGTMGPESLIPIAFLTRFSRQKRSARAPGSA